MNPTREALLAIIQRKCLSVSTIHSDEQRAYSTLGEHGFNHATVNHSENFVNPEDGTHTQNIERFWLTLKNKIVKNMRGTTLDLDTYLAEAWFHQISIIQREETPEKMRIIQAVINAISEEYGENIVI